MPEPVTRPAKAPFHVLIKPIGPLCNLDCEYCYYLEKSNMFRGSKFRMSDAILEKHIRHYIESQPQDCREVNFAWQGGEPTLLGLDFFKRVVEIQSRHQRTGMKISNALQTNGVELDNSWAQFLKANQFLVGISIDGPQQFHDKYRKTRSGKGSFLQVKRGLDYLCEAGAEFNVLTTVQRHNGDHPLEVYQGLKLLGAEYIQFIPIVEHEAGQSVSVRSVLPRQYGEFLVAVFESWRSGGDIGKTFVQDFDAALNAMAGNPYTICSHAPRCGRSVALEHNGDVFSCDHFVSDDYRIGNIQHSSYPQMLDGPVQTSFGDDKLDKLPAACLKCPVKYLCFGGCPAHRYIPVKGSDLKMNYLCAGYRMFFEHIQPYLKAMLASLRQQKPASDYFRYLSDPGLKPRRNDSCPCGSTRKYKLCCGT